MFSRVRSMATGDYIIYCNKCGYALSKSENEFTQFDPGQWATSVEREHICISLEDRGLMLL